MNGRAAVDIFYYERENKMARAHESGKVAGREEEGGGGGSPRLLDITERKER